MNRFTIDEDFICLAGLEDNIDLFLNVLMIFTQENPFRVCMDESDITFRRYKELALKSEPIRFWIRCLFEKQENRKYIDFIATDESISSDPKKLYIEICNNSCSSQKKIIVDTKQSYGNLLSDISTSGISLLDGYEAKAILNTQNIQISYGNNSSNIIGDGNSINPK